ncbi:MAG: TRAP transporter small permease [Burkholderiaceae bacterium]|nr:TRAP transporter small permease [Burkholderiaceae bacterium]
MSGPAARGWTRKLDDALAGFENLLLVVSASSVLAMMSITGADVLMRYVLGAPFPWAFDLLTRYLLISTFFCAFAYTLRVDGHVAVDYFVPGWPTWMRAPLLATGYFLAGSIMLVVCWLTALETVDAWRSDEVIAGVIEWPVWLSKLIVPVGLAPLAFRLLLLSLHAATRHAERDSLPTDDVD